MERVDCTKLENVEVKFDEYEVLYQKNNDFKRYVDRYCVKHRISVEEALQHYLVQMAGKMYKEQMELPIDQMM